jgi:hypothetical protein
MDRAERIEALANAYRSVLGTDGQRSPAQMLVYADLARFCRAFRPTFVPDAREHALLEGRREVWLRMTDALRTPHPTENDILSAAPAVVSTED